MSAPLTIRCMHEPPDPAKAARRTVSIDTEVALTAEAKPIVFSGERLLAYEAMRLFMRLDVELRYTRADFNQDRFRRVMRARSKAVTRLQRRWLKLDPQPLIPLGSLCRRYHANLACYFYPSRP